MGIFFEKTTKTFYLDGKGYSYVFKVNDYGVLEHLYFGKPIAHDDVSYTKHAGRNSAQATMPGIDDGEAFYNRIMPEIAFYGTGDYREPCFMVRTELGDRLCQAHYDSHEILETKPEICGMPSMSGGETLLVHLKDDITGLALDVYYTPYCDAGVISRRIVYKNISDKTLNLLRAYSFTLNLAKNDYSVMSLHGGWSAERNIETIPMHRGVVSIDSKRTTSSATLNPFVALLDPKATEETGSVYGVNLVYSSSFALKVEGTAHGRTLVTGGINDFDFTWKLESGETLETPEAVIAYSSEGIGGMSRAFHDAYREHLINPRYVKAPRPVVINNWEATYLNFDLEKLKSIIDGVQGTGIDTFVLDDGWFGDRNSDRSGLGDWVVNEEKLGGPLKNIIDYAHQKGLKFGLWFEPEMVSEDSDLFRAHPDWAIGAPNRKRCYSRHQYMLDLTRKEIRDYIVDSVNKVIRENEIDYVKWDYNRNVTESFSFGREADRQMEFAHRYALGVYDIFERIVNANPDVIFEGCAGGGARFDAGVLYYFPQIWTSDDSDAEERTRIQYGTSIVYPLSSMSCHFSVVPNHQTGRMTCAQTRADIAHLGAYGYELDSSKFTDADREMVKKQVQQYKDMQSLVLEGDLYRFENPYESNYFAFAIVSKDKTSAHITFYSRINSPNRESKFIYPRGLDENKKYYIKELDTALYGSTIMNAGLRMDLPWKPDGTASDFLTVTFSLQEI